MPTSTLQAAAERYLRIVADSRSESTHRAYAQAVHKFLATLKKHGMNSDTMAPAETSSE